MNIHKKLGPLEAWQWAALLAGGIVVVYLYEKHKSTASTTATGADASAGIDPITGQTYAQDEAQLAAGIDPYTGQPIANQYGGASAGGTGGPVDSGGSGGSVPDYSSLLGEISTQLGTIDTLLSSTPVPQAVTSTENPTGGVSQLLPDITNSGGSTDQSGGAGATSTSGGAGSSLTPLQSLGASIMSGATAITSVPIATQIQLVEGGLIPAGKLGPNAAKIYAAGGTSTQNPSSVVATRAAGASAATSHASNTVSNVGTVLKKA